MQLTLIRTPFIQAGNIVLCNYAPSDVIESLERLFSISQEMDSRDFSLLHKCVLNLSTIDLESLLASLAQSEIDKPDSQGCTACHWAAKMSDITSLTLLLRYGADVERQNNIQQRPINCALRSCSSDCVRLLLDHGCETEFVMAYGWTPLHECCSTGYTNDIIDEFLRRGSDINKKTGEILDSAMTPLMIAAHEDHVDVVQHLILRGADVNATDSFGQCALHIAIRNDNHRCIQRLLEHEVDHTAMTNALESVLHYAAQWAGLQSLTVLHNSNLRDVDLDATVGIVSDMHSMDVKGLSALEIAERRQDVSTQWLDMFRKLVDGIRHPESKMLIIPAAESEDMFHEAQEHQD